MLVTPDTRPFDFLKSDLVRSPGVHASDIYNDLFKKLEPKRYNYEDRDPDTVGGHEPLMALGTAWEKHFEYLLRANGIDAQRPDEFLSPQGIAYSPDLIIFNGVTRVGEIKLTSMSLDELGLDQTNVLPQKFDKYVCQIKLYTKWLELLHGWLAVLSIRQPWKPTFWSANLDFTQAELDRNEAMVLNHGRHAKLI